MNDTSRITQEQLKEYLHYEPETGVFVWIKPTSKGIKIGNVAGSINHKYLSIGINFVNYSAHRLAWLYVYGKFPNNSIDHIDGNQANNRIVNLRECTVMQNQHNTKKPKTNTSGVKGVYFSKSTGKWQASIRDNGKLKHLGVFVNKDCATNARRIAAEELHGEFCNHG